MQNKGKIVHPKDGDFLNIYDGTIQDNVLFVPVKVMAGMQNLKVNNRHVKPAANGDMSVEVPVVQYENILRLTDDAGNLLDTIKVYCLEEPVHKYRLSLDDNILFLRDIAQNRYKSIFDNAYLAFFRRLHLQYDLKLHINILYETDGFNLTQMPECYKPEWKENAGWLQMSFHALADDPPDPYLNAAFDIVRKHCIMVNDEICRFAGVELLSTFTTLHYGSATREGCLALRDSGYTGLAGYFRMDGETPLVSYYLDQHQTRHLNARDIWMDTSNGILFFKNDLVINEHKLESIIPLLESLALRTHEAGLIEMMIHEQYFHPYYQGYQPDFMDKVETAVNWVTSKGYRSTFFSELFNKE